MSILLRFGGTVRDGPPDALNIQYTHQLQYLTNSVGSRGLTFQGIAELTNAIAGFYELVTNQIPNNRVQYARYWGDRIILALQPIINSEGSFVITPNADGTLKKITPNFEYKKAVGGLPNIFISTIPSTFLPKYVEAETGGYVRFTPEFNIPTTFDNANFVRAEDDNYTSDISEFIISPQFNLALHVRPQMKIKTCRKRKCRKCRKKKDRAKRRKFTTTSALQSLVTFLYQTCLKIQRELISVKEGVKMIEEKIHDFKKYRGDGAFTYNFEIFDNGFLELVFCTRYRLEKTDCIVGFTFQGINDIFTGKTGAEHNQIIMNASSVPIDEDMTDAIYPANTGLFIYE